MWDRYVDGLIAKQIKPDYKILDSGMGIGLLGFTTKLIHYNTPFILHGCDIWENGMNIARNMGNAYDKIFTIDIGKKILPYPDKYFNLGIMRGVLAHLSREDGQFAVKELQRISRKQILTFPTTMTHQHDKSLMNDPDVEPLTHKSNWKWNDFKGYNLRGFYLKGRHKQTTLDTWMYPLLYTLTATNKWFCRFTQYVVAWN